MNKQKLILLLFSVIFGVQQIKSQTQFDYANPKDYFIGDISISGIKYLNHNALIQLSGLKVGDKIKIPGESISKSLKKLWKQGLFSDIQISYSKIEGDSIYLDIYLQERPRLSRIIISGLNKSQTKEIEELIDLKKGKQVTDNVLNNVRNKIISHYQEKGFYNTKVTTITKNDTTFQNAVALYINVKKSDKIRIREISFDGENDIDEKKLRRKFFKETKQKRWYGLFKPSKYIPSKYKSDKVRFIEQYNERGYRDAKIISDSIVENPDDNTVSIFVKIEEGSKFYFKDIKWVGNTKFSDEQLNKALKIKKGDVYDQALLDKRLTQEEDAVGNLYMDDGYLFFNVTPVEIQIVNDSIDLELRMVEGPQATINNVTIIGNTRTNDHVIRREIRTMPGELFKRSEIIRTIRELATLGHFDPEQILPDVKPDPANGTVDLEYSLVEKANDQIELSGGWGQGMIVGKLGLTFNNFSTKNFFDKKAWQPLPTGDGQKLSVSAQTSGKYYQSYNITFMEPWLGGKKPNSLSVSFYHTIQTPYGSYYNSYSSGGYGGYSPYAATSASDSKLWVTGASIGLGRRLQWPDDYFFLRNSLNYRRYKTRDYPIANLTESGSYNELSFNTVIGRSSVSQPIYPRYGSDFSLGFEFSLPFSKWNNVDYTDAKSDVKYKWIEYYKWDFKASWFTSIVGDLVLNAKAEFGYVDFYNSKIGPSPFQGFSIGGDMMGYRSYGSTLIGLRGYENNTITRATKFSENSYKANIYNKYSLELRYPISLAQSATIYGLAFVEGANGWVGINKINPFDLYRSAGLGVRIFLPMLGMLGFDWANSFDAGNGIDSKNFHFVLGQQF